MHLWQAVQLTIDTALAACVRLNLGSPTSYANVFFIRLSEAGYLDKELAVRLAYAAGFKNRVVQAYEDLDMQKVYVIAQEGPRDLRAFFASIRDLLKPE